MKKLTYLPLIVFFLASFQMFAQQPGIQYSRSWDKDGINVFEPSKSMDQPEFTGVKVRIGGAFTQDFQSLTHSNTPDTSTQYLYGVITNPADPKFNVSEAKLQGFNLAMANLNFDIQLGDGVRVALENYMSARHHSEFWVKGGYIQFDKLPMFGSPEWYTKYVRVKIGHFQPNFGDMQFRRTDGGNAMYNPFAENLIFDAFSTEIGGEAYVFPVDGFMGMIGMTTGFINGNVNNYPELPEGSNREQTKKSPSVYFKLAYDKQFTTDFRFRLSASMYNNSSTQRNTLYAGDRTGSHYFMVMEPTSGTYSGNKDSGRFTSQLGVSNRINSIMINPFVKFKGLELFGSYEIIKGGTYRETDDRTLNQLAIEGLYRFLPNEQMYIGARYIKASGTPNGYTSEISIDRTAIAAGWFPTKNLLLKGEYVIQNYVDFPTANIYHEGKFSGFMLEAVVGF
ncbi:MAG: hypothetical protein IPL65_14390 [Lewinellaceae bacterium]|nr:hypothetical protein [Lewinellaceae bacterium]